MPASIQILSSFKRFEQTVASHISPIWLVCQSDGQLGSGIARYWIFWIHSLYQCRFRHHHFYIDASRPVVSTASPTRAWFGPTSHLHRFIVLILQLFSRNARVLHLTRATRLLGRFRSLTIAIHQRRKQVLWLLCKVPKVLIALLSEDPADRRFE